MPSDPNPSIGLAIACSLAEASAHIAVIGLGDPALGGGDERAAAPDDHGSRGEDEQGADESGRGDDQRNPGQGAARVGQLRPQGPGGGDHGGRRGEAA